MTSGKGKGKRARRTYETAADIRKGVGLPVKKDFDIWRQGECAKPFFDKFQKYFLETTQLKKGQKGDEFDEVHEQVILGESNGAGRYSSYHARKSLKTSLDWQAWLLYKLRHSNATYRDGCFYGSDKDEIEQYRALWHVIKNELPRPASQHQSLQ